MTQPKSMTYFQGLTKSISCWWRGGMGESWNPKIGRCNMWSAPDLIQPKSYQYCWLSWGTLPDQCSSPPKHCCQIMAQYPQQPLTLFCGGGNLAEFSTAIISFWKEVKSQSQLPSDMNLPPHSLIPNLNAPQLQTHWSSLKTANKWLQNCNFVKYPNLQLFWVLVKLQVGKVCIGFASLDWISRLSCFQTRENTFSN